MATEIEFDNFIDNLIPQSSYLDAGFNTSMTKPIYKEEGRSAVDFGSLIEGVSFDSIEGLGRVVSQNGRLSIDFNKGTIIVNDGANDRVLIGFQEGGF